MSKNSGLTIIELTVVVAILLTTFAISMVNLTRLPAVSSQGATLDLIISDIRSQQTKAMVGEEGGIHFEGGSYTLFKGPSYTQGDPANFTVDLGEDLRFDKITFPGQEIIFAKGSGEVKGYIQGLDSLSLVSDQTSEVKVVRINKYGATY